MPKWWGFPPKLNIRIQGKLCEAKMTWSWRIVGALSHRGRIRVSQEGRELKKKGVRSVLTGPRNHRELTRGGCGRSRRPSGETIPSVLQRLLGYDQVSSRNLLRAIFPSVALLCTNNSARARLVDWYHLRYTDIRYPLRSGRPWKIPRYLNHQTKQESNPFRMNHNVTLSRNTLAVPR